MLVPRKRWRGRGDLTVYVELCLLLFLCMLLFALLVQLACRDPEIVVAKRLIGGRSD